MVALEVNDEELTKRLLLRGQSSGREDDKNEEVIRKRIQEYNNKTLPLKNYYNEQCKFHSIVGIGTIEEIFKAITDRIIFLNAEMDLTALETEIEHLDLTIQDFDVANDIAPELLLEIDAIKRAEAEEEQEEKDKKSVERKALKTSAAKSKPVAKAKVPVKAATKKKPTASKSKPAKKAVAKKKVVKKSVPAKKKIAPKKKVVKKVVAKKSIKKATKKAIKKIVKKVVAKKKVVKKILSKKTKSKVKKRK